MAKNVKLKLANLFLDLGNPRYEEQANQAEALNTIATAQGDKLLALLRDIIEHGLNPSEMLIVAPMEEERGRGKNSYVVLEGNRRVAAMKLLRNPNILRDDKLKARYAKLHDKHKNDPKVPKQIECVVLKPEVARLWIERKHEGELGGVGVVPWDSVQKTRFQNKNSGKDSKVLQLIDFMKGVAGNDEEFAAQIDKIGPTNFERLFSTPEVRYKLGLDVKNGMFVAYHEPDEIMRGLRSVVQHMAKDTFTVDDIYYKDDRLKFIAKVSKDGELPDETKRSEKTWVLREYQSRQQNPGGTDAGKDNSQGNNQNDNQNENKNNGSKDNSEQRPTSRETLIPADLTLTIPNERINRLFVEMKSLVLNESPNICAVMMRVFVEWSIDAFLETYEVKGEKKLNVDINRGIKGKFTDVVEKMKTLHCINPDHLKGIETAFSEDRESIFSFHTLNAYVHNNTFNPIPTEIMYSWDNAEPFIKAIWKAVNDKLNKNKQK